MSSVEFKKKMLSLGFQEADDTVYNRMIISVDGPEKGGKTNFSLTAPDPIAFFSTDIGTEGVVNKFKAAGKDIWEFPIQVPEKADEAKEIWDGDGTKKNLGFKNVFKEILRVPELRTVVFDTETELWELLRIRRFGKLTQVLPFQYGPVNAEFRRLLKMPYDVQKNLILLKKQKPIYIDDKRTSKSEPAGFTDTKYIVQANIEAFRTKPKKHCDYCTKIDAKHRHWVIKVKDSRHNPDMIDKTFIDHMASFPLVASLIIEGTDVEDWE